MAAGYRLVDRGPDARNVIEVPFAITAPTLLASQVVVPGRSFAAARMVTV